ncbi:type I glyceraldehyde-3-phosphate dehydrogenase [Robiginitomaculum antarcticum]|uniref:type I glyceraldehyde-3-phosphate dehydrogenase n=1 Tax=Robiginitomaculum antarcticum TaxID=437507 RepID=UPI00038133CD|nr:type I glyceraldehyde-3-phosphate dehydrogenase [Robiginitomaculum antarcticum]
MPLRIAINGFGRIGRMVLRAIAENEHTDMQVVAINDLADAKRLAHLLKYDSIHGPFPGTIASSETSIDVNGSKIAMYAERNPEDIPWGDHSVDIVMECTGFFLTKDLCGKHIMAGAKRVLMSAPAKDNTKTIVYGVNDNVIDATDIFLSNASCTTNALAPLLSVLNENYGIKSGMMTTIHAYTGDQPTHDAVHKDPYRGRAAALSMVPTTTGAARAIEKVIPDLSGKLEGVAVRVPVPNVSMVDLTVITEKETNAEDIDKKFKTASESSLKGILGYIDEPLVSVDMNHNPNSSSFIREHAYVSHANLVRVMAWYDNEWGFSNRMIDTARAMGRFL